ncbi:MAG: hypothetical protein KIT62_00940 [Cyclobacteriaceae bacterium]|nr:hypothetical protein [Cyclobacteriaceae bacterium]
MKNFKCSKIVIASLVSLFSCLNSSDEIIIVPTNEIDQINSKGNSSARTQWTTYDEFNILEVKEFFTTIGPGQHNTGTLTIPSDYIIVGGGAMILDVANHPNAFITESRPDFANNAWVVSTKDHRFTDVHSVKIAAIGIKLLNFSSSQVRSYMQVFTNTSTTQAHPTISVTVPSDYQLIGGGARVNYGSGAGNLLTVSVGWPFGNIWIAESKDHFISSPASITAYAIGIKKIIPNLYCNSGCDPGGFFDVSEGVSPIIYAPSGSSLATTPLTGNGWAISSVGAAVGYSGAGRMLQEIFPGELSQVATSRSRDQSSASPGSMYVNVIRIKPHGCWAC